MAGFSSRLSAAVAVSRLRRPTATADMSWCMAAAVLPESWRPDMPDLLRAARRRSVGGESEALHIGGVGGWWWQGQRIGMHWNRGPAPVRPAVLRTRPATRPVVPQAFMIIMKY